MEEKKRRQHYVFQAYLNAWTNDKKIWCIRERKKIFTAVTINVAQERDFYRIRPLNKDEKKFYELIVTRGMGDEAKKALLDHIDTYLTPIEWQKNIKELRRYSESKFKSYGKIPDEINQLLLEAEKQVDISINNIEENYYSDIESESIEWINSLKEKNTDFYHGEKRFDFLYFLCVQYFRTKAIRERWISNFEPSLNDPRWETLNIPRENIHLENLVHPFFWYTQNTVAFNLEKRNAHLTLLINETEIPFITSDQPVINLCGDYQKLNKETKELIFYYPISPNIAITINDNNLEDTINIGIDKVIEYNNSIAKSSYELIFANSKEVISKYSII